MSGPILISTQMLPFRVVGIGRIYFYLYIMYTRVYFKYDIHFKQNALGHLKINILNDWK